MAITRTALITIDVSVNAALSSGQDIVVFTSDMRREGFNEEEIAYATRLYSYRWCNKFLQGVQ